MVKKVGIYHDRRKQRPWIVRWYGLPDITTGKPKRYSKAFDSRAEAEGFRIEQVIVFEQGRPRNRADEVTLGRFCADFLRAKKNSIEPKTYRQYSNMGKRLIGFFGDDILLRQIQPQGAHQFIAGLEPMDDKRENLSGWSRKTLLAYCKAMFNFAVSWELIRRNPFSKVRTQKAPEPEWQYLDIDDYKALLQAAPSLRWKVVYALPYTCGLRKAKLLNLQWADIDFAQRLLTVRSRKATDKTPPFKTKNRKKRVVPVPADTLSILSQWCLQQGKKRIPYVSLTCRQYENVVKRWRSYRRRNRPWENEAMANNMMREFRRHIKKAGIEADDKLTIHTLRKCAGKNWADRIPNAKVVQELMGHADISTTMKFYNKLNDADIKKAASAIDDLLTRSDAKSDAAATA